MTIGRFTEAKLEDAIIQLLAGQGYPHVCGREIVGDPGDVLIRSDLLAFLSKRYASDGLGKRLASWADEQPRLLLNLLFQRLQQGPIDSCPRNRQIALPHHRE